MGAFTVETAQGAAPGLTSPGLNTPAIPTPTLTLGRQLPKVVVALLTPAALVALAIGLWRVSADLDWAGAFPIATGLFSHWQVWIALSIALKMLSSALLAWEGRTRRISEANRSMF